MYEQVEGPVSVVSFTKPAESESGSPNIFDFEHYTNALLFQIMKCQYFYQHVRFQIFQNRRIWLSKIFSTFQTMTLVQETANIRKRPDYDLVYFIKCGERLLKYFKQNLHLVSKTHF